MTLPVRFAVFMLAVLPILAGGCASGLGTDSDAGQENVRIASSVKAALAEEPNLSAAAIGVDVDNRIVFLSGFVDSESQRTRAIESAQAVAGVREVRSELQVK